MANILDLVEPMVVGQALYVGFLFGSEDVDAYMIGLTCRNQDCAAPRDGIRLMGHEFATPPRCEATPNL